MMSRLRLLWTGIIWCIWPAIGMTADTSSSNRPIKIVAPKLFKGSDIPAIRTPLGLPNDYKPWIVQLKSGDLLMVAFSYGEIPSNELPKGAQWKGQSEAG